MTREWLGYPMLTVTDLATQGTAHDRVHSSRTEGPLFINLRGSVHFSATVLARIARSRFRPARCSETIGHGRRVPSAPACTPPIAAPTKSWLSMCRLPILFAPVGRVACVGNRLSLTAPTLQHPLSLSVSVAYDPGTMAPVGMPSVKGPCRPVYVSSRAQRSVITRAAAQEVAPKTVQGPVLNKKYHGPHAIPEEGISRIVDMLRKGDLFRYGGNDEGSLQVCFSWACSRAV